MYYLAPLNYDRFFRKIFKDIDIAKSFLEDFLDVEIEEINKLEEKHRITDKSKVVEFDYRCKIAGKYIIIDMQQWYKPDVTQRFYVYHALNSALQLEDLKTKAIPVELVNDIQEIKKAQEIKDYRLIEPVLTLIWMVDDSLGFKNDFVSYKLLPEEISKFIENNAIWHNKNIVHLLEKREAILEMLKNNSKDVDFLQKNKLIFMFQKNIVKNMEDSRALLHTPGKKGDTIRVTKYSRWFDFAYKTLKKNNSEEDFVEYQNDSLFKTIISRLDQSKLSDEDKHYIEEQSILWEKVNKYGTDFFDMGRKEGMQKGMQKGMEKGMEKEKQNSDRKIKEKQVEIAKNLLDVLDNETIAIKTGLTKEEVEKLR